MGIVIPFYCVLYVHISYHCSHWSTYVCSDSIIIFIILVWHVGCEHKSHMHIAICIINILKLITIYSYHLFPFSCAAPTVAVSDITVTWVNETAVRVAWTALTLNDARGFPSYMVSVTSKEKEVANVTTNFISVVVGGLMPHTEYNVTVQALTAGGTKEGPHSAPGEIQLML